MGWGMATRLPISVGDALPFKDGSLFGLVHESLFLELIGQEVQNRLAVVKVTVGVETVGLEKAGDFALNAVRMR